MPLRLDLNGKLVKYVYGRQEIQGSSDGGFRNLIQKYILINLKLEQ